MIDAVDLFLGEVAVHDLVELACRPEVGSERLLDDDTAPLSVRGLRRQAGATKLANDRCVDRRWNGEIEERAARAVDLIQTSFQAVVERRIAEIAAHVIHALGERAGDLILLLQPGELAQAGAEN